MNIDDDMTVTCGLMFQHHVVPANHSAEYQDLCASGQFKN
jgi:hypothetical protein